MTETPNLKIPHGGYVVVGDGRRALVLRNEGHALHL
ncbi:MAG: host attachment protein, partial [Methylorubrum extorquens]